METKKRPAVRGAGLMAGTILGLGLFAAACAAEGMRRDPGAVNPGTAALDPRVQEIAERILADAVKEEHAREGFAIVADPQAGRILAIANVDAGGGKSGHWSLGELMEPASLAKGLVAAEAIEEGKTTPSDTHYCEHGSYSYGGNVFHDWRVGGFGRLSTAQTIARSSDICAIKIAEKVGEPALLEMLKRFGFGPGGSAGSFPESRSGVLPTRDGRLGNLLLPYIAYGQGFQATPLEVLQAYGAIANGGELLSPIQAGEPGRKVVRRVLSRESAESMKRILEGVVLNGTAKEYGKSALYTTAGKTGTGYSHELDRWFWEKGVPIPNVALFVGFAPVSSPRVEVYVGIREPHTDESGAHGSTHAVPVFRRIADAVLQEWGVAPDRN